jgi:hypothetical protein
MGSGTIGLSTDVIAGVSVDFAMLCYRQSEEKSAKAPLTHKVRGGRANPNLGKMFRHAGSAAALNPWRCPLRRGEAAALGLPGLDATYPLVSKVHSQGERHVQLGRLIQFSASMNAPYHRGAQTTDHQCRKFMSQRMAKATDTRTATHLYSLRVVKVLIESPDVQVREFTLGPGEEGPWHYHTNIIDTCISLRGLVRVDTSLQP